MVSSANAQTEPGARGLLLPSLSSDGIRRCRCSHHSRGSENMSEMPRPPREDETLFHDPHPIYSLMSAFSNSLRSSIGLPVGETEVDSLRSYPLGSSSLAFFIQSSDPVTLPCTSRTALVMSNIRSFTFSLSGMCISFVPWS